MRCTQCNKQAVASIQGANVCVEHASMFQQSINNMQMQNMAMMNYLGEQIEYVMGARSTPPRIQIPQAHVSNNRVTNHNINIDRSVVGSVNSGQIGSLELSLNNVNNGGAHEVAQALKLLTETLLSSEELHENQKNESAEFLAFLAEQASLPEQSRKTALIKSLLNGQIPNIINLSASAITLWEKIGPVIRSHFNI